MLYDILTRLKSRSRGNTTMQCDQARHYPPTQLNWRLTVTVRCNQTSTTLFDDSPSVKNPAVLGNGGGRSSDHVSNDSQFLMPGTCFFVGDLNCPMRYKSLSRLSKNELQSLISNQSTSSPRKARGPGLAAKNAAIFAEARLAIFSRGQR